MRVSNSQRGLSLVELIIAAGILSAMSLAAVAVGGSLFKPLQDLTKNLYDSMGSDISVRSMAFQFTNSEVMRGAADGSAWVTCTGHTTVAPGQTRQNLTLAAKGDAYGFAYTRMRTLGSTSTVAPNTIIVPDTTLFQTGMDLLITTLDPAKNQGIFVVTSIDTGAQSITVSDSVSQPPTDLGCRFLPKGNSSILFNNMQLKKFAIESLAIIKYAVADQPGQTGQLRLMGAGWPAGTDPSAVVQTEIVPNFISLQIAETFSSTTTTKGIYAAAFTLTRWNTKVRGGTPVQSSISATAGYSMAGVEISNSAAVPNPPSIDNLFVTCGLSNTVQYANYIDGDSTSASYGNVVSVYRIDPFYSESDVIDNQAPQLAAAFSTTGAPVRCWQATQVDCTDPSALPTLKGAPSVGGTSFTLMAVLSKPPGCGIDTSNALMVPAFCAIPDDALATSKLNYSSPTAGAQTVNCSDSQLAGLTITWSYDGTPSHCSNDGSIFIGRLINPNTNPAGTGPVLGIKANSCSWTGSASTSCNAFAVLKSSPNAQLQQVKLTPEGTKILGGGTTLSCN